MRKFFVLCALLLTLTAPARAEDVAVDARTKEWTDGNNYIVNDSVTIGDRIEVKGSVTLTLNDGCELNARDGINVPGGSSLTIKTPSGPNGTGKLIADLKNETWGKAAIGANRDGSTGTIRIEGGNINAIGGYNSAGIGGAKGCGNGTIIITGGTIYAKGQSDGAGIGGGERGGGGTIRIEGGKINAIGGMMAAGIGGGQHRGGGDITITGGDIYAQGGEWAAGIGGGDSSNVGEMDGGNINISGGRITAIGGGNGGYGIGAGDRSDGGRLSSDGGGSAWIETNTIKTDKGDFRSGVLIVGNEGTVYGSPTMKTSEELKSGKTLKVDSGRTLTVGKGVTLTVARGARLTAEGGGRIVNDGSIVSNGIVGLAASGTIADIKKLGMTGKGVVEMGGREYNNYGGDVLRGDVTIDADRSYSETPAVMEGAKLTIPQGVTLTLTGSPALVNYGGIVNKGTVVLPAGIDRKEIKTFGIQDDMANDIYGFVQVGDNRYASDGGDVERGTRILRSSTGITNGTWMLMSGARLEVRPYVFLMIRQGQRLIVHDGATLSVSSNSHGIRNDGMMRLPAGTDIPKLRLGGSGRILMGGKYYNNKGDEIEAAVIKQPTKDESAAADKIAGKYIRTGGRKAAAEEDLTDGIAEVKEGDILIDTNGADGTLCAMSVNVAAQPNEYAVIANGQMGDISSGGEVAMGGTIVFANRFSFIDPNDAENTKDIEFDKVSVSEAGAADLDLTIVVVNGKADEEVQALPEYKLSGLADGQGLAVFYDEETKVYVLVIFDGDETDGVATAHICAKEGGSGSKSSGGGCSAGAGLLSALALLGLVKIRR